MFDISDVTPDIEQNEIPSISDFFAAKQYEGTDDFITNFFDSIKGLVEVIRDIFGIDDTSGETKEFDENLTDVASDIMTEVFDQKTIDEWSSMSMEERESKLDEYYSKLGEALNMSASDVIVEDCEATCGAGCEGYNNGDGTVHVDVRIVQDPERLGDLLNTLTHEARHQLQNDAIDNPAEHPEFSQALLDEWEHNMVNYNNGSYDYESYYNQGIEVDARVFAADVVSAYIEKMGY